LEERRHDDKRKIAEDHGGYGPEQFEKGLHELTEFMRSEFA